MSSNLRHSRRCISTRPDTRSTRLLSLDRSRVRCASDVLSDSSRSSDTASWETCHYVVIELRLAITGRKLGQPTAVNMTKSKGQRMTLASLLGIARHYESGEPMTYRYSFMLADGELVDCDENRHVRLATYVEQLPLLDAQPQTVHRDHMLTLLQYPAVDPTAPLCAIGPHRPDPRRGDWIKSRGPRSRLRLRFYSSPRSHGTGIEFPRVRRQPATHEYLGPVHRVDHTNDFASVQVPHPDYEDLLVWVDIWVSRGPTPEPVCFAYLVPSQVLARWFRRGFHKWFRD